MIVTKFGRNLIQRFGVETIVRRKKELESAYFHHCSDADPAAAIFKIHVVTWYVGMGMVIVVTKFGQNPLRHVGVISI